MNILKIGKAHVDIGANCQDAIGRYGDELKIVCDGCSEGKHSEVGAQLFAKLFVEKYAYFKELEKRGKVEFLIQSTMDDVVDFVGRDKDTLFDYLSFTTIIAYERTYISEDSSMSIPAALYVGDGYLIVVDNEESEVQFINLDCGEYPEYLSYNYINPELLKKYKDGVEIHSKLFDPEKFVPKKDGVRFGVASDGIRFVVNLPEDNPLRQEFVDIILSDRDIRMKRFINKHPEIFKDDVSIVI